MSARRMWLVAVYAGALLTVVAGPQSGALAKDRGFEVWLVDQSNTNGLTFGGTIYIYNGRDLTRRRPSNATPIDTVDLGAETSALCLTQTGANPVRPHMLAFNSTHTHAALSFGRERTRGDLRRPQQNVAGLFPHRSRRRRRAAGARYLADGGRSVPSRRQPAWQEARTDLHQLRPEYFRPGT